MAQVQSATISADGSQRDAAYNRSACTECQRRKQKCNREWPCDRCQRRKIADECRYGYTNPTPDVPAHDLAEKLKRTHDDYANRGIAHDDGDEDGPGFDALASRLYATLGIDHGLTEKPAPKQDYVNVDSSPQVQRVLKLLPQRKSMDTLLQNFFSDINYHYYIIYPPVFLQDYHIWWDMRLKNRLVSLQYTCLLAIICACSLQHVDAANEKAFETELGDALDVVSDQLHGAMRELASVIPVGHYNLLNVQRLLHSCYWYKAEAKFLEAWHVLSAAILEGRELGYHKEPPPGTVSDFDLEMRRRLWCILDTWDWQISSGLSRPKIIDRSDCNSELPELTLEGHEVSPLLHMKMQSQLTRQLASRFSAPKNIIAPAEVQEYKIIIEEWVDKFPPEYSFESPDTSKDQKCPWLFAQRFYVYTMACLLILNPIRHYMVKKYTRESPQDELKIRDVGVRYSLKLMKTMRLWVDKVYNRDGRLHFIIFSIFDTAAILCTAILKDTEHAIPNRHEILAAIGDAVDMLKKLNRISKTSKTSYDILERLVRRLPDTVPRNTSERQAKRPKVKFSPPVSSGAESVATAPPQPTPVSLTRKSAMPSQPPQSATTMDVTAQVLRPVAAPIPAAPIPLAPLPVPSDHVATPIQMAPHQYNNQAQDYTNQHMRHDVNYMTLSSHSAPNVLDPSQFAEHQPIWSTMDETTDPRMGDRSLVSSFSATNRPTDVFLIDEDAYEHAITDPGADFNIENLSQTQLGELAPLWTWHSENLDLQNLPPPNQHNGYPMAM